MPPAPALREPSQDRSRRTLDRIVKATERLLDRRPFEQISVGQIVRAARSSVGSFYARFPDKDALLPVLYARYGKSLDQRLARLERELSGSGTDLELEDVALRITRYCVRVFRERRNLMKALAMWVRTSPNEVTADARAERRRQHEPLFRALLAQRALIAHPDAQRAVEHAVYFAVSACRDRVLFSESTHAASVDLSDRDLARELARMMVGFLTVRFADDD